MRHNREMSLGYLISINVLIGCLLAMLATSATVAWAGNGTIVRVAPDTKIVKPGDVFDVSVEIESDVPSRGMQVALSYDSNKLEVLQVTEGSFYRDWALAHYAQTLVYPPPVVDNQTGKVLDTGMVLLGGEKSGPVGTGTVFVYRMRWKGPPGISIIQPQNVVVADTAMVTRAIPGVMVRMGSITAQSGTPMTATNTPAASATVPAALPSATSTTVPTTVAPSATPTIVPRQATQAPVVGTPTGTPASLRSPTPTNTPASAPTNIPATATPVATPTVVGSPTPVATATATVTSTAIGGQAPRYAVTLPDADINGDSLVNIKDVLDLGLFWGHIGQPGSSRADINRDGIVDIEDVNALSRFWGK